MVFHRSRWISCHFIGRICGCLYQKKRKQQLPMVLSVYSRLVLYRCYANDIFIPHTWGRISWTQSSYRTERRSDYCCIYYTLYWICGNYIIRVTTKIFRPRQSTKAILGLRTRHFCMLCFCITDTCKSRPNFYGYYFVSAKPFSHFVRILVIQIFLKILTFVLWSPRIDFEFILRRWLSKFWHL